MKRILLIMAAALIGLSAMAKDYGLYICGRRVTDANKDDILGNGTCSVYFDGPSSSTAHLVLNNCEMFSWPSWGNITTEYGQVFFLCEDNSISAVVVEVYGLNILANSSGVFDCVFRSNSSKLIFEGNGELNAYATERVIRCDDLELRSGFHDLTSDQYAPIYVVSKSGMLTIGDDYAAYLRCRSKNSEVHQSAIYYGGDYKYNLMEEAADKSCTQHPFCYYYRTFNKYYDDFNMRRYDRHRLRDHGVYYTYEQYNPWTWSYSSKHELVQITTIQGNSKVYLNGGRLGWSTLWDTFRGDAVYHGLLNWDIAGQTFRVHRTTSVQRLTFGNDIACIDLGDQNLHITGDLTFYRDLRVYGTGRLTIDGNVTCTGTDAHCTSSEIYLPHGAKLIVNGECNLRNTDIRMPDNARMTVNSGVLTGVNSIKVGDQNLEYLEGGLILRNGEVVTSSGASAKGKTINIKPARDYALKIGNTQVNEANYTELATMPGVKVDNGGYLRYNPASKKIQMKDVELSNDLYIGEDITMEILGTNLMQHVYLTDAARNLTIVGQESNQQSKAYIWEGVVMEAGGRVTFNNMSGYCPNVRTRSTSEFGSVSVQACTMTFEPSQIFTRINSFEWTNCYITPSTATYNTGRYKFENLNGATELKFTMHDGSKAPLAIEAFITGIDVNLNGNVTSANGYTISADERCTSLRLTEPGIYQVRTMCRVSGNGSTGAKVRLAGEESSVSASYLSAGEYEKSVVKYTANSQPTTYTASAMAIGTSAPYDTVRSQPLRVEIPAEITAFGPLECKIADGLWIYVEEGEKLDLLVYEGDTVWARVVDDCYPRISLAGAVKEDGVYHTNGRQFGNITALREKYDVLIWGDVAMTDRLQTLPVNCGDAIGDFWSDPSNKSEQDQFLGWALEGTMMPFYSREEIMEMVVTTPLNINAVFVSDLVNAGEDDPDTAIDEIYMRNDQLKAEKIVSNGHVYIIVDNVVYDITGQKVE